MSRNFLLKFLGSKWEVLVQAGVLMAGGHLDADRYRVDGSNGEMIGDERNGKDVTPSASDLI